MTFIKLLEPLFHFLEHLYLFRIACRVGEPGDGPLLSESLIFKKTGEFWNLVVRYQPFSIIGAFNLKFFHISYSLKPSFVIFCPVE